MACVSKPGVWAGAPYEGVHQQAGVWGGPPYEIGRYAWFDVM